MRFNFYPVVVTVPALSTRDVYMPAEDRAFRELTIYGRPQTARTSGDRSGFALVNVTGVVIDSYSPTTATGAATGTLSYFASPRRLQWQAPGAIVPGDLVGIETGTAVQRLTLPGGDGSSINVTVTPAGLPLTDQSDVSPVALAVLGAQVRAFSSQVFFGPTSQGAAAVRANDEMYLIFDPGDTVRIWPPNERSSNPQRKGRNGFEVQGFPIMVRIVNSAAAPLGITIEYTSMTIENG